MKKAALIMTSRERKYVSCDDFTMAEGFFFFTEEGKLKFVVSASSIESIAICN